MIRKKWASLVFLLALPLFFLGCASHSNKMDEAKVLMRYGEYAAAEEKMSSILGADHDKLLRQVEFGVLSQLKGNYHESLAYLEVADKLADELYTVSFSDLAMRATTNATFTIYRGNIVERVYINYFKMLNYFYLAEESTSGSETKRLLDSARVEARRAMILLDENVYKVGDYDVAEEEKQSIIYKLQQAFTAIDDNVINLKELAFRDNAFSHYIIGTLFEKMGEFDSARVSYERAANLYEKGYTKQYSLDIGSISQAWLDTARMLKARGDKRWRKVASQKLNNAQRVELNKSTKGHGQLIVIQEVDMIAPRGELNLLAKIQGDKLIIRPIPLGTPEQKSYQLAWFYYLYNDKKSLSTEINKIKSKNYMALLNTNNEKKYEKTYDIHSLFKKTLESLGLIEAMTNSGIRLSVPLLYYEDLAIKKSHLEIAGQKKGDLLLVDNISGLAMAQHLVGAQSELINTMAIEALRLVICMQTGAPAAICTLTLAATASADTRSWLSLPYEIRTFRTSMPAGEHELKLVSNAIDFKVEQTEKVNIKAGEVRVIRMRTFVVNPNEPLPKSVQKARDTNKIVIIEVKDSEKMN